jgi:hypothetical protein
MFLRRTNVSFVAKRLENTVIMAGKLVPVVVHSSEELFRANITKFSFASNQKNVKST